MSDVTVLENIEALAVGDAASTVLRHVDLVVEGPAIAAIGPNAGVPYLDGATVIDATGWLVYPGLVNTHHHFFQAFVRNLKGLDWPKPTLIEWLDRIYRIFSLIDADCVYHTSVVSMAELIKYGCTTTLDHMYCYNDHAGKYLVDRQFEAADLLGMRYHAGRGTNTLPRAEGSTMPDSMVETTDEFLADCERLIDRYHDASDFAMRRIVVAPCQPVNCYKETFVEALRLARDRGVNLHTHLSEGENDAIEARYGMRSLDWCESIDFVGEDVFFAHGWQFTRDEFRRLGENRSGVVHCPAPVYLVGDVVTDLCAAAAFDVRVGLGVDGQASNDNSNLLECIRSAYLLQSLTSPRREDPVPEPETFLRWASAGSAALLGREDIGQLLPGRAADLFAVDSGRIELVGATHDPVNLLCKVGVAHPADLTMINGQVVWRDGAFTRLDERQAAREADAVFRRVIFGTDAFRREAKVA